MYQVAPTPPVVVPPQSTPARLVLLAVGTSVSRFRLGEIQKVLSQTILHQRNPLSKFPDMDRIDYTL